MAKAIVPGLQERLRSLVNGKGWDYVVYWKLNDDQRFIDWVGCCCGGVTAGHGIGADFFSPQPHYLDGGAPCPDISFPHPSTKTCTILSAMTLSPSIPLDSAGVHAQVLLSGQPRWINFSLESNQHEGVQTKVYIPIQNGIVELGSSSQIAENAMVIQSVKAKCGDPWQDFQGFQENVDQQGFKSLYKNQEDGLDKHFNGHGDQVHWTSALDTHPWEHDVGFSDNQFSLNIAAPTQLNFLGQPSKTGGQPSDHFDKQVDCSRPEKQGPPFVQGLQDVPPLAPPNHSFSESPHGSGVSKENSEVKQETRADSSDCSDQVDEDDEKATGRSGRRHLSKNLVAERKRRKKLNERLYSLRALVPKITKMDRASILGDAIEYVKELQQQVKELQDELEDDSQAANNIPTMTDVCGGGHKHPGSEGITIADVDTNKCALKADDINDKKVEDLTQPMQVEVSKMDAHLLTLRIFCEKRPGVFVKLMQALDALGLDVLHANITTFRGLVLNVFNAEMRDKELMQAEQVKETLLEMTSQPEARSSSSLVSESHMGVITIDG
ncbi:hypothetical protein SELMODRAFT_451590 [Selaginella moellendorffii]|uniref:Uncharacterized protein AMS-1 n=1 Tax=Selaginella moellendorffii TaxID=88036 RepID=D8SQG0_SELML|nr:transcription factor ABORTED MICROSPORES [Selaginella moellendorffii]EFJ13392.1 hypothetical protein SELMODRAFT_451590 [Selaginella moellendorffii]|eukprot:XP_002985518.1 transcription factor ABORTED MICROSPORES [Selaginella moellendorffii]